MLQQRLACSRAEQQQGASEARHMEKSDAMLPMLEPSTAVRMHFTAHRLSPYACSNVRDKRACECPMRSRSICDPLALCE